MISWRGGLFEPQGPIALAERAMLENATVIMLAVVIPVIVLTLAIAWWFRAGNPRARRTPDWEYSGPIEVTVWSIPILVVIFLGGITWIGSYELDPAKPLPDTEKTIQVQVVSLDWKWLFIYPDYGIATVNHLQIPTKTPVRFTLTSSGVMNSFFVPQLGSQIYTMAGMTTTLHLQASKEGAFPGISAQFSGDGFSDMRFTVNAVSDSAFEAWLKQARSNQQTLDATAYQALSKPGIDVPYDTFGKVEDRLFEQILAADSASHHAMPMSD